MEFLIFKYYYIQLFHRYRVELDVHDGEHGATFVILDKEMRKLTNKTATTIMEEKVNKILGK